MYNQLIKGLFNSFTITTIIIIRIRQNIKVCAENIDYTSKEGIYFILWCSISISNETQWNLEMEIIFIYRLVRENMVSLHLKKLKNLSI